MIGFFVGLVWGGIVAMIGLERGWSFLKAMDSYAKGEPVRTSFDHVFPGMPPALKLSA